MLEIHLTKDQEDDIVNIFDRLETVEDLYDMLLSSISPCFDCSKLSESECISEIKCEYTDLNVAQLILVMKVLFLVIKLNYQVIYY